MTDTSVFGRLKKLFSTNTVVRNVKGKQLNVIDTDQIQSFTNRRGIDRFTRVYQSATDGYGSHYGRSETTAAFQGARLQLFRDYDMMDRDPIISSVLDIYADECVGSETLIPLLDGTTRTIKDLYDSNERNFWVYSIDKNGIFIPAQCERVAYNGKKRMYKITLDDGTDISATENHLWMTTNNELIQTSELQFGTSLKVIPRKISSTEDRLSGYEMLYQNGKWEYTHRLIGNSVTPLLEQRDKLDKNDRVIHHKSFNKLNNVPTELEWLNNTVHYRTHAEFNKALWSDPSKTHVYKDKIKLAHKKYWTTERKQMVSNRQRSFMKTYIQKLTQDERNSLYGRSGSGNGMWKNGQKITGSKNGRYRKDINRTVNFDQYIKSILDGSTISQLIVEFNLNRQTVDKLNKEICKRYNVSNIKTLRKLNRIYGVTNIIPDLRTYIDNIKSNGKNPLRNLSKFLDMYGLTHADLTFILNQNGYESYSEFATSNNHRVVSIEYIGEEDAYDLVNVGESHIYAIQGKDGSRIFCHNCTVKDEFNKILTIRTDNTKIKEILHNLFYDILNIEFNLWPWIRNAAKYGDFFLYLDIDPEYGIVNTIPLSIYETSRVEGFDPGNPFATKFTIQNDFLNLGKTEFDNYEIAHFRLLSDTNFLPYGKALIEGGRRVWKQLQLMEDAMLVHRIMRAPDKRKFKIDIGNIPPAEVETYMQRIVDKMKKVPLIDPKTGDYNLRYNMMNVTEDFYLPVRGRDSGTEIETMQGLQFNAIEDIEYLRNKLMAAFKVPKAFLGYEEDLSGKASLAAQDVRFARTIERIQRVMVSELTKLAVIHLYVQGFTDEELVNFDLSLTNPSTLYEQEKINLWQQKFQLASSMTGNQAMLFSQDWVYKNILEMSDEEVEQERVRIIADMKRQQEQQASVQSPQMPDPLQSTDDSSLPDEEAADDGNVEPEEFDDVDAILNSLREFPDDEDDSDEIVKELNLENPFIKNKGGRPKEGLKFGTDKHPLGRDPLGHKEIWKEKKYTHRPMSLEARNILHSLSRREGISNYRRLINEHYNFEEKPTISENE